MSDHLYHLSDPDNRDDNGASYEFTGTLDRVTGYLDEAVRGDLNSAEGVKELDRTLLAFRDGDINEGIRRAKHVGVYIHKITGGEDK